MKLLWQIKAVKTFLYLVLLAYIAAVLSPWVQILFGYVPPRNPTDSWWPTPIEYAFAVSISVLVYVGMFAVPLIVASIYTVRSLRKKYNAQQNDAKQ
jgi:uncharacterized membrane protein (DUF485 family)